MDFALRVWNATHSLPGAMFLVSACLGVEGERTMTRAEAEQEYPDLVRKYDEDQARPSFEEAHPNYRAHW